MRGAGVRRPPKESLRPSQTTDPWQFHYHNPSRDSDASFSSRPSSIGGGRSSIAIPNITDHAYKQSAVRSINSYLSSHNLPFSLSLKPIPSGKDIIEVFKFLLRRLDFSCDKLEDDLPLILRLLSCPHKFNKSALKAPGTPHSFPYLLAVMHWLVLIANYNDHLNSVENTGRYSFLRDNSILAYAVDSYSHFLHGDDDAVDELDREFTERMENERHSLANNVESLDGEIAKLEAHIEGLRSRPSERENLENERNVLEADVKKFDDFIKSLKDGISVMEQALEDKEKEMSAKVEEKKKICEENEELKKRIEMQDINVRDAERMKRELQAVEREIGEAEASRSAWEEKCWDLDSSIGHKFKELETLAMECNQALKRLKLGDDLLYLLNTKGSTPAEVLGLDYKSKLKPSINSFLEEVKKGSMSKLEEKIALQKQAAEMHSKIEAKKNRFAMLQSHIDEVEAQLNVIKKEIQDNSARFATEARRRKDDVEAEAGHLDSMEAEAIETLKNAELSLQKAIEQSEIEVQMCAHELFALIDMVSKFKEYVESNISGMNNELSETVEYISKSYKNTLPAPFRGV